VGNYSDEDDSNEDLAILLDDFLSDEWSGTATELCSELNKLNAELGLNTITLTKQLKSQADLLKREFNIEVKFERSSDSRRILLSRIKP